MSRRKARLEIGERAFEEADKILNVSRYGGMITATKTIGCNRKAIYEWKSGKAPDAIYLQRLHEIGADVIYILTGLRVEYDKKTVTATDDMVEVVRCRDCKHQDEHGDCDIHDEWLTRKPDSFCCYGERRSDD